MQNVVCSVFAILLNRRAAAPIVPDNKTVLLFDCRYWIMYFMKKLLPLPGVPVRTCRPFGFVIIKSRTLSCS
jgi:hypothetical protein